MLEVETTKVIKESRNPTISAVVTRKSTQILISIWETVNPGNKIRRDDISFNTGVLEDELESRFGIATKFIVQKLGIRKVRESEINTLLHDVYHKNYNG